MVGVKSSWANVVRNRPYRRDQQNGQKLANCTQLNDLSIVRKLSMAKSTETPMKTTIEQNRVLDCPHLAQFQRPGLRCGLQVDAGLGARIGLGA